MSSTTSTLPPDEISRLNSLAIEVPIEEIVVGERVRRDFSHVPELARSLSEEGLIQPVVLDYTKKLIAGESRIRAAKSLGWKTIRAVFRGVLDEAQLVVLEATENNARKGLTWQERVLSVDKVHRLRSTNAMLSGERWGVRETGELLKQGKSNIGNAVLIAEYLHKNDQEIWACESLADALRLLIKRQEDAANAALAKFTLGPSPTEKVSYKPVEKPTVPSLADSEFFTGVPSGPSFTPGISGPSVTDETPGATVPSPPAGILRVPLREMLIHAKAEEWLKTVPDETFDHSITDWPYAIDMENFIQDVSSTAKEHDVEDNLKLQRAVIPEIFRVLKPNAFFITWMDAMHWNPTYDLLTAAGFKVQRWPLIWQKTSSCANQAAQTNFTKNYEIAVVARKGVITLNGPQASSVWQGSNDVEAKALGHPFAKPFALWDWLYSAVCVRGSHILEPFAGRGSAVVPALRRGLRVTAVECNEEHYNSLVVNVSNTYRALTDGKVEFV